MCLEVTLTLIHTILQQKIFSLNLGRCMDLVCMLLDLIYWCFSLNSANQSICPCRILLTQQYRVVLNVLHKAIKKMSSWNTNWISPVALTSTNHLRQSMAPNVPAWERLYWATANAWWVIITIIPLIIVIIVQYFEICKPLMLLLQ